MGWEAREERARIILKNFTVLEKIYYLETRRRRRRRRLSSLFVLHFHCCLLLPLVNIAILKLLYFSMRRNSFFQLFLSICKKNIYECVMCMIMFAHTSNICVYYFIILACQSLDRSGISSTVYILCYSTLHVEAAH